MKSELGETSPGIITTVAINVGKLSVFLTQHPQCPEQASSGWALPCTFTTPEEAVGLQCLTDAGIASTSIQHIERLGIFFQEPTPEKIHLAFFAFAKTETAIEGTAWCQLSNLPLLSCEHQDIIAYATTHLWLKLATTQNLLTLLPESSTLWEVQDLLRSLEQTIRSNRDHSGPVWA